MSKDQVSPKFLYKYRAINNLDKLDKDYAIDALLNNYAIFSSRKAFNDLFDSKIELIHPTPKQLKNLRISGSKKTKIEVNSWIDKGNFTRKGIEEIRKQEKMLDALIDSYPIYSLAYAATSNLMWSHYADSHKGFCIEFKSRYINAQPVIYASEIPKLELIEIINGYLGSQIDESVGTGIDVALRTKLNEWSYEKEHRIIASKKMAMERIPSGEKFIRIPYSAEWVESVIFGCRMPQAHKEFIVSKMPVTKLKQAIEKKSQIEIIDYMR